MNKDNKNNTDNKKNILAALMPRILVLLEFVIIIGVALLTFWMLGKERSEMLAKYDNTPDSEVLSAINSTITNKVQSFDAITSVFIDMDVVDIKRLAQWENYDGAEKIATVYDWAVNCGGMLLSNSDITDSFMTESTEGLYKGMCKLADNIENYNNTH